MPPIANVDEVELVVAETNVGPLSRARFELLPSFSVSLRVSPVSYTHLRAHET